MGESTVGASEFKAKCLRLLDEVAERGSSFLITKRGRPIARVLPVSPVRKPLRGTWKGLVKVKGDIVYFGVGEEWENRR
ncbi:MAG: type II toxin-antitoxin system Phd/YefM family antitoxin [Acidobacteriota bacterium]